MIGINEEQKQGLIGLVGLQGYIFLKEPLTKALNGIKLVYVTDYKPILKRRKHIMREYQNIAILNRKEEKIFLLFRKKKKEDIEKIKEAIEDEKKKVL